jgi:hypothetical protein
MYWAREVSDNKFQGDIYFIVMCFFGAFIIVNLAIAVQFECFLESKHDVDDEMEQEEEDDEEDPD